MAAFDGDAVVVGGGGVGIGEGRHVFRTLVISRGGGVADLAAADLAVGGRRREIAGGDAIHKKGERALVEWRREERKFSGEGEAVVAGEFVVDGRGGGGAFGVFAAVFDDVVSEVGFVGGGVGILRGRGGSGDAVGDGTGAAPSVGGAGFLGVLFGHAAAEGEAEAVVDGFDIGEVETGVNLAGVNPARAGGLAEEVTVVVAHHQECAVTENGPGAVESATGNHVHRAGERGARGFGCRRVQDLEARDVVHRDGMKIHAARSTAAGAAGDIEAADGDGHVFGGHAANRD